MENYTPSYSYPDSGDSSPRSREVDFDNAPPPSWEDHPHHLSATATTTIPPTYKVKFMVSYGGKIQPRSHDNLLSYVGGETKILAVDRSVKFSAMHTKLATLVNPDAVMPRNGLTVKYQLPGEDLDALISVTNDDDLEHMMHEYDRMWRGSSKSVRLRLFLFFDQLQWGSNNDNNNFGGSGFSSVESETGKFGVGPDRVDKVVDGFVSREHQPQQQQQLEHQNRNVVVSDPSPSSLPVQNNVDFLFGLDKVPVQVPGPVPVQSVSQAVPVPEPSRFQISAQEVHQFQLQQQQQQQQQQSAVHYAKNDENFGDSYQRSSSPANIPVNIPAQIPQGYWQPVEHLPPQPPPQQPPQMQHQQYHPQHQQQQQPVYMMHAPQQGSAYHAPMMRGQIQPNQGYFQPLYSTPAPAPAHMPAMSAAIHVRPVMTGESTGYAQVAYDSATGRQVYYAAAQGGVVVAPPYTAAAVNGGEMRSSGDGKVSVNKGVPSSNGV